MLAACVLHNFLRSKPSSRNIYSPPDYIDRKNQGIVIDAEWRQNAGNCLPNILQQGGNRSTLEAREIRDKLCDYFNTNGEVSWEWDAISNEKMCVLTRFVCDFLGTTCVRRNLSKIS